eukprot:6172338-Pleurochrysis_carterae.AAC.4
MTPLSAASQTAVMRATRSRSCASDSAAAAVVSRQTRIAIHIRRCRCSRCSPSLAAAMARSSLLAPRPKRLESHPP